MPRFTKNDTSELDYQLLENGSVTKYFQVELLKETVQWLKKYEYKIIELDYGDFPSLQEFLVTLANNLNSSEHFQGNSIDAFDDILYEMYIPDNLGLVIIIYQYNLLMQTAPEKGWQILNILDRHSRRNLLYGQRLITLVQTTDPTLDIGPIGSQTVSWNQAEWQDYQRGLASDPFSDLESWFE